MTESTTMTPNDIDVLRDLAWKLREAAESEANAERRRMWYAHNALQPARPMVLAEPGGVMNEIAPTFEYRCTSEKARALENLLLKKLYPFNEIGDDEVIEPSLRVNWMVQVSDYGVMHEIHRPDTDGSLGSYVWEAPIKDLDADFHKLRMRTYSVDRQGTLAERDRLAEVFDGILDVHVRGAFWWTLGLTWSAIRLVGLENLMLLMYDNPEGLHRLMAFLRDDALAFARWLEAEGLLTLNNAADYVGSGGRGFTHELPAADYPAGGPARLKDLWVLSESQETVGVSPELFAEFIFPYQDSICREFGLTYYGCCEPVHSRWHVIQQIANLRSVSVSPWCDQAFMAEAMGDRYVFSRKPNPTLISTDNFDEQAIREDLRTTLKAARGCPLEIVMKDVHTLGNQPERLGRWVQLARETIDEVG